MCRSHSVPLVNQLNDLLLRTDEMLGKTLDLNLLVLVLKNFEHFMIVEQVVNFTAIYFIHRNGDCKVSLVILPVVNTAFE